MSYLLDALRKSEEKRPAEETASDRISARGIEPPMPRRFPWLIILLLANALVAGGGLVWYIGGDNRGSAPVVPTTPQATVDKTAARAVKSAKVPATRPAGETREPSRPVAAPPATQTARAQQSPVASSLDPPPSRKESQTLDRVGTALPHARAAPPLVVATPARADVPAAVSTAKPITVSPPPVRPVIAPAVHPPRSAEAPPGSRPAPANQEFAATAATGSGAVAQAPPTPSFESVAGVGAGQGRKEAESVTSAPLALPPATTDRRSPKVVPTAVTALPPARAPEPEPEPEPEPQPEPEPESAPEAPDQSASAAMAVAAAVVPRPQLDPVDTRIANRFQGRVVGIKGGCEIEVAIGGEFERVRLSGIDCPPGGTGHAKTARSITTRAVFDRDVQVVVWGRDPNGDLSADVYFDKGKFLNAVLVRAGLAWAESAALKSLEDAARATGKGMWALP